MYMRESRSNMCKIIGQARMHVCDLKLEKGCGHGHVMCINIYCVFFLLQFFCIKTCSSQSKDKTWPTVYLWIT